MMMKCGLTFAGEMFITNVVKGRHLASILLVEKYDDWHTTLYSKSSEFDLYYCFITKTKEIFINCLSIQQPMI